MARTQKTGYDLTRQWFDFAFEKFECKAHHTALYLWIIELNNRLGWKETFGLPMQATMEGLSIGNKTTYSKTLRDIESWGFIKVVQEAKNQYQSCLVQICQYEKEPALSTALSSALNRHSDQHSTAIDTGIEFSTVTIDKPLNLETFKPLNDEEKEEEIPSSSSMQDLVDDFSERERKKLAEDLKTNPPELRAPPLSLDEYQEQMLNNQLLMETCCLTNKMNEGEFQLAIRDFFLQKKVIEHVPKDARDVKQHFLNWVPGWKTRTINQIKDSRNAGKGKIARGKEITDAAADRIISKLQNGFYDDSD